MTKTEDMGCDGGCGLVWSVADGSDVRCLSGDNLYDIEQVYGVDFIDERDGAAIVVNNILLCTECFPDGCEEEAVALDPSLADDDKLLDGDQHRQCFECAGVYAKHHTRVVDGLIFCAPCARVERASC